MQLLRKGSPVKEGTCKECRKSMRRWALDWRREVDPVVRNICLAQAISWRNGSFFLSGFTHHFPQTVLEVAEAERYLEKYPPKIPESLKDSQKLLDRIKARNRAGTAKIFHRPSQ